mgnify:CR=1 FL=1
MTPAFLERSLNRAVAVTLQANSDLTLNAPLQVKAANGTGGALTLQAGRTLNLNANLTSANAPVTLIANDVISQLGAKRNQPDLGKTLTRESLRFLYRLLFLLWMGAGEAKNLTAGRMRRRDPCHRILDDDAIFSMIAGAAGRFDEHVGLRLRPRHMLERGDAIAKERRQPGDAQGGLHALGRTVRGDAIMMVANIPQRLRNTRHNLQFALIEFKQAQVLVGRSVGRKTDAIFAGDFINHGSEGLADKTPVSLLFAHLDAVLGQDLDIDFHRQGLTVDAVSYTHLRAHETVLDLVCRLLLEKKTQWN